jgi:hypothetical protein
LLALLRDPAYTPGNEFELSRRLELKKKERASLAHEVRAVLKSGDFRSHGKWPDCSARKRSAEACGGAAEDFCADPSRRYDATAGGEGLESG